MIVGRPATERNDCTVRALAIAAGMDYAIALAMLTMSGRRMRCRTGKWAKAFKIAGLLENPIPGVRRIKVKHLPQDNILILIRGHIFAVKNGIHSDGILAHLNTDCKVVAAWRI